MVGKVAKLVLDARAAHGDKVIKVGRHIVYMADRVG